MAVELAVQNIPDVFRALMLIAPVIGCGYARFRRQLNGSKFRAHDHPVRELKPNKEQVVLDTPYGLFLANKNACVLIGWVTDGEKTPDGQTHLHDENGYCPIQSREDYSGPHDGFYYEV